MCGRVVQKTPLHDISVLFETVNPIPNAAPTYNGAPTDRLPVVRLDRDSAVRSTLRWGSDHVFGGGQAIGVRCINAICETVATSRRFGTRSSAAAAWCRRSSSPVAKGAERKQPYAVGLADGFPMAFAGLWERGRTRRPVMLRTFKIITGPPNELSRRSTIACR